MNAVRERVIGLSAASCWTGPAREFSGPGISMGEAGIVT